MVGVVQVDILKGLLELDCAEATCPRCGKVNTFPGFSEMSASPAMDAVEVGAGGKRMEAAISPVMPRLCGRRSPMRTADQRSN